MYNRQSDAALLRKGPPGFDPGGGGPGRPRTGAQKVVEARDYYPFGLRMPGRSVTTGTPAVEDYTGHELDVETGMHYAGARYYMSALGRWNGPDPLADDL